MRKLFAILLLFIALPTSAQGSLSQTRKIIGRKFNPRTPEIIRVVDQAVQRSMAVQAAQTQSSSEITQAQVAAQLDIQHKEAEAKKVAAVVARKAAAKQAKTVARRNFDVKTNPIIEQAAYLYNHNDLVVLKNARDIIDKLDLQYDANAYLYQLLNEAHAMIVLLKKQIDTERHKKQDILKELVERLEKRTERGYKLISNREDNRLWLESIENEIEKVILKININIPFDEEKNVNQSFIFYYSLHDGYEFSA